MSTAISYWGPFNWSDWDSHRFRPTRSEVTEAIEGHRPPDHDLRQRNGIFGPEHLYCKICEKMVWSWDETDTDDVHSWD